MSSADINAINQVLGNIQSQINEVTGNTLSSYNQLSRIVAQQSNIYNTIYYGLGNLNTGNLTVNNSYTINGNLTYANLNFTGNLALNNGNLLLPNGNILSTLGNIVLSNGNILSTVGNVIITNGNILSVVGNLVLGNGNLGVTTGNVIMSNGNLRITAGNVIMSNGNLGITAGNVIMSNGNLGISVGNIILSNGDANIIGSMNYGSILRTVLTDMGSQQLGPSVASVEWINIPSYAREINMVFFSGSRTVTAGIDALLGTNAGYQTSGYVIRAYREGFSFDATAYVPYFTSTITGTADISGELLVRYMYTQTSGSTRRAWYWVSVRFYNNNDGTPRPCDSVGYFVTPYVSTTDGEYISRVRLELTTGTFNDSTGDSNSRLYWN